MCDHQKLKELAKRITPVKHQTLMKKYCTECGKMVNIEITKEEVTIL